MAANMILGSMTLGQVVTSSSCFKHANKRQYSEEAKLLLLLGSLQVFLFCFVFFRLRVEKYSEILRQKKYENS